MTAADRVYVAGTSRPGGLGTRAAAGVRPFRAPADCRTRAELDLTDGAAVDRFFDATRPRYRVPRGSEGRRDRGQRHLSGRFHPRQSGHPAQRHRRGAPPRHGAPLLFLGSSCIYPKHAPQPMKRGASPVRPAGADQRAVRHREDRRAEDVRGLPPPVRIPFRQRDADEPLRPERQLRSGDQPRAPGAHPSIPRGETGPASQPSHSGARARPAVSSCTWTTWPTPASS
jgi:hypothetical protein